MRTTYTRRVVVVIGCAAVLTTLASTSDAQVRVEDAVAKDCASANVKGAVVAYLTGGTTPRNVLTTKAKTLRLNGPDLSVAINYSFGDRASGDLVSLPYTSSTPVKVAMSNSVKGYDATVCVYDLKASAKSWSEFDADDLVPAYGRSLVTCNGASSVLVPTATPKGVSVRGSRVVFISSSQQASTATFTASLKQ